MSPVGNYYQNNLSCSHKSQYCINFWVVIVVIRSLRDKYFGSCGLFDRGLRKGTARALKGTGKGVCNRENETIDKQAIKEICGLPMLLGSF